jgi:flagellar motility protein MotE (MotC chaperone)
MKKENSMKKWLLSTLAIAVVATSVHASELQRPYNKLKKQIDIMSNIISTSLSEGEGQRSRGNKVQVEGVYLKSQGIVFEVNSNRGFSRLFREFGHDMDFSFHSSGTGPVVEPVAPFVISQREIEGMVEIANSMEQYEDALEVLKVRSEYARDLREKQRELAYEVRSYTRRQRDLEFESRHADEDEKQTLKQQMTELKKEVAKLASKEKSLRIQVEKEEKGIKEEQSKRAQKIEQVKVKYFASLDSTIAETLCDYGAGLRLLQKSEYVTFVIDMGESEQWGHSKKIHTFSKKSIIECVMENKTPAQLLKSAQSYYF